MKTKQQIHLESVIISLTEKNIRKKVLQDNLITKSKRIEEQFRKNKEEINSNINLIQELKEKISNLSEKVSKSPGGIQSQAFKAKEEKPDSEENLF